MNVAAYYNEIDPYAAAWLRNLIAAGHIAPGDVDERSIEDVIPTELAGYRQCHFFAGVGVWSYALRAAGWPDDREVWTGSCPCQPFSAAGEGRGFDDERHLWPSWLHLIAQRRPAVLFGEQVASKDAGPWIDLVHDDMEALGYAFGAVPFPSAGVGAPHIRDRLYWVADSAGRGLGEFWGALGAGGVRHADSGGDALSLLGNAGNAGLPARERAAVVGAGRREEGRAVEQSGGAPGGMGLAHEGERRWRPEDAEGQSDGPAAGRHEGDGEPARTGIRSVQGQPTAGPTNGLWRAADWLLCRDGKFRSVEPGTFPLAHGAPGRVGRLRAYGNAINVEAARIFIECVMPDYIHAIKESA